MGNTAAAVKRIDRPARTYFDVHGSLDSQMSVQIRLEVLESKIEVSTSVWGSPYTARITCTKKQAERIGRAIVDAWKASVAGAVKFRRMVGKFEVSWRAGELVRIEEEGRPRGLKFALMGDDQEGLDIADAFFAASEAGPAKVKRVAGR